MSRATIISLLPWKLEEEKPGQFPEKYLIDAAPKKGDFSIEVIEDAYYLEFIPFSDEKTPPRRVPILSTSVAQGIVDDYLRAQLATSFEFILSPEGPVQALPGLFWIEGGLSKQEVAEKHGNGLIQNARNMKRWFMNLVKIADDDWARYHRHNVISDKQRAAASWLALDREWNFDVMRPSEVFNCPFCFTQLNPAAAVCFNCKQVVNAERFKALQTA